MENTDTKTARGRNWQQMSMEDVFRELKSSKDGLSEGEVQKRREQYGRNELEGKKKRSKLSIFISQFKDVMILILAIAAIISFIAGEQTDAFVIVAIILGNAVLGYVQEFRAEQSIQALQKMAAQEASVIRDGQHKKLPSAELVPGDLMVVEAGDIVPADARLVHVNKLKTEEAALTGESLPVEKHADALAEDVSMAADMKNMVFKSTAVSYGSARAVVTATGMNTEVGKIAKMLHGDTQQTPLQKRLAKFSKQLAVIVLLICAVIFGLGWYRGEPLLHMFLTALSLAVAALPEALPAVITISLARGAARMVKQNALIRRLPAVETLGSVTYICSDKTGTLTQNKMTMEQLQAAEGMNDLLLQAMLLNHEVKKDENDKWLGDPTEIAFIDYAVGQGLDIAEVKKELPIEKLFPFDSDRMMMASLHKKGDKWLVLVKGAPVKVAEKLKQDQKAEEWLQKNRDWAAEGQRVLFFAYKEMNELPGQLSEEDLESELKMLGVAGIIDPPREEVLDAIKECHEAGIDTVMITGDQPLTARAIAERLSISEGREEETLTGAELLKMDDAAVKQRVMHARVYARVSPEQKLNIVKALQEQGEIVAMTGDGVNDAPSLKQADIGVAMGITGTDVSKEAAHMILLDDNFTTIVKAVKEGRRIYANIRKFIQYVLSCNLAEILLILMAPFFGLPIPLLPIHILWINLVTDGFPGLAIAAEKAEKDIMKQPPRPPDEPLFTREMALNVLSAAIILFAASIYMQYRAMQDGYDTGIQQTMVFTTLCFTQLMNALSIRAGRRSIFTGFWSNKFLLVSVALTMALQAVIVYVPFLQPLFHTSPLDLVEFVEIAAVCVGCGLLLELAKLAIGRLVK